MTVIKYNPFKHARLKSFDNIFDELSGSTLSDIFNSDFTNSTPSVNITENEGSFFIEVAAPGLTKEDFDISLDKDHLTISAEIKNKKEEIEEHFTKREFNYSSFKRRFHLSDKISKEGVSATYENGILGITLLKKEDAEGTKRTIEIV